MNFITYGYGVVENALRVHQELRMVNDKLKDVVCVDFYDENEISYYVEVESQEGSRYQLDNKQEKNPKPHVFNQTPIVKVVNKEEEMVDFYHVINLIDGFKLKMSDEILL